MKKELHEHVEYRGRTVCSCGDFNCASLDTNPDAKSEYSGMESPEREALSALPYGPSWRRKVRNMHDQQVIAVYLRLKKQGKV